MTATRTPQHTAQDGMAYRLPEAQRQAILSATDSARLRQKIHAQREIFLKNNRGCEFGQKNADYPANSDCKNQKSWQNML